MPRGVAVSSQQSATLREADVPQRLVGLGGRVGVAQRLVGDEQVPVERLQVGGVAVEHAVGGEHDAGAVAEPAVERAQLGGDRALLGEREHLDVGRQRRQSAPGRAVRELVAPLAEQPALGDDERAEAARAAGAVRERAAGRDRLAGADLAGVDARADDLQRGHLLLAAEQHRVVVERPRADHAHGLAGAGVQRDACACWRLSARSSAIACSATTRRVLALSPSALVIVSTPGRPFMRPTRTVSLR